MDDGNGKCLLDVISDPSALNEFLRSNNQENNLQKNNPLFTSQSTIGNTVQHIVSNKTPVSFVNSNVSQTLIRNMNGSTPTISNSPRQVAITKSSSPINNVTKGVAVSYQAKKPIPIQPKNPAVLPNTSIQSSVLGGSHHGRVVQAPTTVMSTQVSTPLVPSQISPASIRAQNNVNGLVDVTKARATSLQPNRVVQSTVLATPPKRIAPKQVISPPISISPPVRLQKSNIQNKQNVQLIQAASVQGSNNGKLFPQQLTTVVNPLITNQATTQSIAVNSPQPVQQIQQLINDKLSAQQSQAVSSGQTQQKVLTQAQLQTALKQSQLIAQNSPGQAQNILVQQEILKQLIQQAKNIQQNQSDKQVNVSTTVQGAIPIQQTQMVKQTPQQVTVVNQNTGSSPIQVVLPSHQLVTLTQNPIPVSQQTVNVGQQGGIVNTTSNKVQPMIIVSQAGGNFVLQQHVPAQNTGLNTTAGNTVNIPVQNMIGQQKHIPGQIKTTAIAQTTPQQVKNTVGTVQIQQPKQIPQTVVLPNQGRQNNTLLKQKQQNVVIQSKPSVITTQPAGNTIQQVTPAQLQQLQTSGGVQKVFIIKQPEVLQKLTSTQTSKAPQTIQITPQQLQVLQQMQSQQSAQKIIIQSKGDGNTPSTTVLTAQQLKQIQQSLQQQTGNSKVVQISQKQTLPQQNTKTPVKMGHVPRILQTSGRQSSSQVSSKSSTVKQEPSRGIKRPHVETPEPPKVVRRLKAALYQDQQAVTHPDIHTPFKSKLDAVNKLRSYHVYHDPGQTPSDIQKSDMLFRTVSMQLIKKSEKMMEKYRGLVLDESMRNEPSSEMVMLFRLFLTDERASLAQDKGKLAEELKALKDAPKINPPPSPTCTTTTSLPDKPTDKLQLALVANTAPPKVIQEIKTTKTDILNTKSLMDTSEDTLINDHVDEEECLNPEENEIDKAVFNMESSASYYKPVNHLSDSLIDSPRTTSANDGDDSTEDLMVDDDDTVKEDVTATLALLHSMAEELDDTIT